MTRMRAISYQRPRRIVPLTARGLKGRCVVLEPGSTMEWHSTGAREELLIAWQGRVRLEVRLTRGRVSRIRVRAGHCPFLPTATMHRVVNDTSSPAAYLYVTGPVSRAGTRVRAHGSAAS